MSFTNVVGSGTTVGNIIDAQGYESITFEANLHEWVDGVYTPLIEDGDDAALSDAATVTSDYLVGTPAAVAAILISANTVSSIGYIGKKRYVRISLVASGVTSGGSVSSTVILGDAHRNPIPWNG